MDALDETARIGARSAHPGGDLASEGRRQIELGKNAAGGRVHRRARASGLDIAANTYAYTAWFNTFSAFIPPWAHDGGDAKLIERLKDPATRARIRKDMETPTKDWDNEWQEIPGPEAILIGAVQNPKLLPLQGKTLAEIAKMWHEDPIDTIFDLLIEDQRVHGRGRLRHERAGRGAGAEAAVGVGGQRFVGHCARGDFGPGASASARVRDVSAHPRKYVREENLLTLPDAIRKFSRAAGAAHAHLADRGVLKDGMWADVVVFDPEKVHDVATFENPNQLSVGMDYVLVNGVPVIEDGKMTGKLPGKVLRGPGYRDASK